MNDNQAKLYKAFYLLAVANSWDNWEWQKDRDIEVPDLGRVRVLSTLDDSRSRDRYDEFGEGSTAPAGIVFRVQFYEDGSEHLYQKDGTYDSYGTVSYSGGSFFEVVKKEVKSFRYERV
ncbi:hypothetical protein ACFXG4_23525 [Nocardia sp. NPDC059246]|uniref:hypothetical protein n=1 Tax=unclassified Nocardia TaxID=2637762 RepID=UPI00368BBD09